MEKINLFIGIVLGVFGVIAYTKGFFGWIWDKIKSKPTTGDGTIKIPKRTLALVIKNTGRGCSWQMGSVSGEPAMHISAHFTATNICNLGILPTTAKINKPKIQGHVMIRKHDQNIYGSYIMPKGVITELSVDFWITPPIKNKGEDFKANVAIVDQFGNEHWVKKIEFKYS